LAVHLIGDVARSKDAFGRRVDLVTDRDVSGGGEIHYALEETGVGFMPDVDEDTVCIHRGFLAGYDVTGSYPRDHLILAEDLLDDGVPDEAHLGVGEGALLRILEGAQLVTTMNDDDLTRKLGEEHAFLDGGVTTTHDDDLLVPVEEPVAGCAGAHAATVELVLAGNAKTAWVRTGRKDDGAGVIVRVVALNDESLLGIAAHAFDLFHQDAGTELLGLPHHALRKLGSADGGIESGVVLYFLGLGNLPTGQTFLEDDRVKLSATGVNACREACGASANNHDVAVDGLACHGCPPVLACATVAL